MWSVLVALTATPAQAQADTTPPTLGATVGDVTSFGSVIGTDIHLYFSEAIDQDPENLPPLRAFYVRVDGVGPFIRVGSVRGGAESNELVLGDLTSPIARGQTASVGYVEPSWNVDDIAAIQDLAGNDTRSFDFTRIHNGEENTTDQRPVMDFLLVERSPGNRLLLRWGLFPTSHGADSYDVQYARATRRPIPESAWLNGPQNLTGAGTGHAFGGDRTYTIKNLDYHTYYSIRVRGTNSHGAGEWSRPRGMLTNPGGRPTLIRALVRVLDSGTELRLPFYQDLDRRAGRIPPKELFQVTADGVAVTIGDFDIREGQPRNVYLGGVSPAVRRGQTVTVSYHDPTPIDGTAVLQGTNGADVKSFSNAKVKNWSSLAASDPGVGPAPESARVDSDGNTVIVSFDEDVNGNSLPGSDAFAVTVGGTEVALTGVVSGDRANELHIEIGGAIIRDQTVTVSYTKPASGNVVEDSDGNAAESFTDYPVDATQAPQSAPPEPLTASFEDVPTSHDGSTAFTVELAFSEELPVTEDAIRAGLTVGSGTLDSVGQTVAGENRRWDIAVTPLSSASAVSIVLTPKASCADANAICTEDGRGLSETVEARIEGRPPTVVTGVAVTSTPGDNGTWDTGETVAAHVRFSNQVTVVAAPGTGPVLTVLLDGTRRQAAYHGSNGTDTLTFRYTVTAADDGATRARVAADGLDLNGTILGDNLGRHVQTGFSVAPYVTAVELVADISDDGEWTPGESIEARLTFSEAVAVADGTPTLGVSHGGEAATLDYASGSGSATLVFSRAVTATDGNLSQIAVTANSLALNGAGITSSASGLAAELGNDGTNPTSAPANPLTAEFRDMPDSHGGAAFTFKLRFGEELALSYLTLRDEALEVTDGTVSAVRRATQGENRVWNVTVTPASDVGDVTVTLLAWPCTDARAVCTVDDRGLAEPVSATVPKQVADTDSAPFEVRLVGVPDEHVGSGEIVFSMEFTKKPKASYSYTTMRDSTLKIHRGETKLTPKVRRLNKPHNDRWEVTVAPGGNEDVTVEIGPFSACTEAGAVCTAGNVVLTNDVSKRIHGPPGLMVLDAKVYEAAGATVEFPVLLIRASSETVTVDYATSDGPAEGGAVAGSDYTQTSGTLTFAPGVTLMKVSVPVLPDSHDEGDETFTLTLSNPTGGNAWLKDATATGTIENTDAMPQAWLARFGRTVAEQVLDAVESRFLAPRTPGVSLSLAGQAIGGSAEPEDEEARTALAEEAETRSRLEAMTKWLQGTEQDGPGSVSGAGARAGLGSRAVTERDLLIGSSFSLASEAMAGGLVSLWGRGAVSRFDGREGDLTLDGEVTSAMLGADWTRDAWTAGLLVSRSEGTGSYRGEGDGQVESSLTGVFPYGRYMVNDRVTLWGAAGYGEGTLTLTPGNPETGEIDPAMTTDMDLSMVALGIRGVVVEASAQGGPELSVKSDAMALRTSSEKVAGLEAADAQVTRLRLGLEGTWRGIEAGGGVLVPRVEVGVRHDGGDAESGFGIDLGGGLSWSHPASGISVEVKGRSLLTHEAGGFRDRGLSGSLAWDPRPGTDRGASLTLTQSMGASASGGMDALLSRGTLAGLAANNNGGGGDALENRRLDVRLGYGFPAFEDRFTSTPELGLGLSNGYREYSLGWRLGLEQSGPTAIELKLEGSRREHANDSADPEHGIGFKLTARW